MPPVCSFINLNVTCHRIFKLFIFSVPLASLRLNPTDTQRALVPVSSVWCCAHPLWCPFACFPFPFFYTLHLRCLSHHFPLCHLHSALASATLSAVVSVFVSVDSPLLSCLAVSIVSPGTGASGQVCACCAQRLPRSNANTHTHTRRDRHFTD